MSLLQFLRILAARRLIIIVSTLSCVIAAFVVASLLPTRYESNSRLMLDIVKPDPVTGEVIATQFARAYTRTQVELVREPRVVARAVEILGMDRDPELQQAYLKDEKARGIGLKQWVSQRIIANTKANLVEGSNILQITHSASTPEAARDIANALRQAFIEASLAFRRDSARRTADWYQQQTQKAQAALQLAEQAKTVFERKNNLILEGGADIDSARLQALSGATAAPNIPPPALSGPVVTASGTQLAQVDAQIGQAARVLGPNHPDMQALQARRAALATQVMQERAAAGAAAGASNRAANAGSGAADRAYQAQRSRVVAQRDELEQLRRLQTEVDLRRDHFTKTAARTAELQQESEVADAGLTPLGTAEAPTSAAFPNKPLIMIGALLFGLAFGVLLALLLELLNRRVRSAEDMDRIMEVPLLAVISSPHGGRGEVRMLGWSNRN